jgi:hypothetical protein
MKNKLMVSVAALALIAAGGLASAQNTQAPAGGGAAPQQSGGEMKGGAHPGGASQINRGADVKGGSDMRGTTGQAPAREQAPGMTDETPGAKEKAPRASGSERKDRRDHGTTGQASPSERSGSDVKSRTDGKTNDKVRDGAKSNKSDMRTDSKSGTTTTTGQGAAGGRAAVNLSTEQRTRIQTVIKEKSHVRPATNINFSVSVGARVPRSVHLYPLPVEVVDVYPSWRGYQFILVGDEIVVIDPNTFEIVAVIEA